MGFRTRDLCWELAAASSRKHPGPAGDAAFSGNVSSWPKPPGKQAHCSASQTRVTEQVDGNLDLTPVWMQ